MTARSVGVAPLNAQPATNMDALPAVMISTMMDSLPAAAGTENLLAPMEYANKIAR